MKIGIVCYPTFGGSGVVATELGIHLAENGHEVHFITYERPVLAGCRLMRCCGVYAPSTCLLGPLWWGQPPVADKEYQHWPNRPDPTRCCRSRDDATPAIARRRL